MSRQASRTASIRLKAKSTVPVHYTFTPGSGASADGRQLLIVCLSGLCDRMKVWNGTLKHLAQFRQSKNCPPMLTYDRFGCGKTGHDPSDAGKGPTEWHDLGDAAKELHELLLQVYETELGISSREKVWPIFVAHSIGTAVAQLYAAKFPGEAVGYLLLDATLTDSDGTSLMPDPDAPGFDATALPGGITPAMLRDSRMKQHSSPFNRNMPNMERLRWNNIQEYIPVIGAPKFTGPAKGTPLITLMMHDDQAYAKQLKQTVKVPEVVSMAYVVPAWRIFLSKLSSIGAPHLTKGPLVTKGSGHFIHQEKPDMVALELSDLLDKLYYLLDLPASKL